MDPHGIDAVTEKEINDVWSKKIHDFTLNNQFVIFRSDVKLWKVQIEELRDCNSLAGVFPEPFLDIEELCGEDDSKIENIYGGNAKDGSKIVFMIRRDEEEGTSTVVSWNLLINAEINQYEVQDPYAVSFDDDGNCVIVRNGEDELGQRTCLIDIDDRSTKTTAFDFDEERLTEATDKEKIVDEEQISAGIYSFAKGNRFNAKGHDWLVLDNYLALSFSYMSFVIKDMIEHSDPSMQNNLFDIEPYNYIFNKRTSFTDSNFITEDSDELKDVLDEFEKYGPDHLNLINYTRPRIIEKKEEEQEKQDGFGASLKRGFTDFAGKLNPLDFKKRMQELQDALNEAD